MTSTSRFANSRAGPEALAAQCQPLLNDPVALAGYQRIADKFANEEAYGPITVRRFMADSAALGDMSEEQIQADAFRQVRAWLHALGIKK